MNARIKKLWVAALRSGKWEKHTGSLRGSSNSRCCLGVLCEVYMEDTGKGAWLEGDFWGEPGGEADHGELIPSVVEWAGVENPAGGGVAIGSNRIHSLTIHNDGQNIPQQPFPVIADAIEEQL